MRECPHASWDGRLGGWVGSQLGGTAWMLALAVMAGAEGFLFAAAYIVALFAVANAIGVTLWLKRRRLRFWTALIWLVVTCGATGAAAIYIMDATEALATAQMEHWAYSTQTAYLCLAAGCIGAILMVIQRARLETGDRDAPGGGPTPSRDRWSQGPLP